MIQKRFHFVGDAIGLMRFLIQKISHVLSSNSNLVHQRGLGDDSCDLHI